MGKWRDRLVGFAGLYMIVCAWIPPLWYASSLQRKYGLTDFIALASTFEIVIWAALCLGAALASIGLALAGHKRTARPDAE